MYVSFNPFTPSLKDISPIPILLLQTKAKTYNMPRW